MSVIGQSVLQSVKKVNQKKGNPTLACQCALITEYTNVNLAWS